jgi:hypothetical protein
LEQRAANSARLLADITAYLNQLLHTSNSYGSSDSEDEDGGEEDDVY